MYQYSAIHFHKRTKNIREAPNHSTYSNQPNPNPFLNLANYPFAY